MSTTRISVAPSFVTDALPGDGYLGTPAVVRRCVKATTHKVCHCRLKVVGIQGEQLALGPVRIGLKHHGIPTVIQAVQGNAEQIILEVVEIAGG